MFVNYVYFFLCVSCCNRLDFTLFNFANKSVSSSCSLKFHATFFKIEILISDERPIFMSSYFFCFVFIVSCPFYECHCCRNLPVSNIMNPKTTHIYRYQGV